MGRGMNKSGPTLSSPVWAADFMSRDHLVPAPAKLLASAFTADANGVKLVKSGTVLGCTKAELIAGDDLGPAADTDELVFIVAFEVDDAADINDVELYRPGSTVKANFLPDWGTLSAAVKGKLQDQYICILGVA